MGEKDFLSNNMSSWEKRYPESVFSEMCSSPSDFSIEILDTKDKNKTIKVMRKEKILYLHSKYSPLKEAYEWSESVDIREDTYIIIFGFGLGYHIKEVIKKMRSTNKLFIIEPSCEIFHAAMKIDDYRDILQHPNVFFMMSKENNDIEKLLLRHVQWNHIDNLRVVHALNYDKLFPSDYSNFMKVINKIVREQKMYHHTALHFAKMWQQNFLQNIPYILQSHDVSSLKNFFRNDPIIIVSAGPSLNKNVKLLRKAKGKAVLICVGTALKTLIRENIRPDLVIAVDGGEINFKHFENISYDDIPFVYNPKVFTRILENHKGDKICFYTDDGYMEKILSGLAIEMGKLKCGGSVSNSAFDLAVKMGGNPIVLIGQDLAFTDGKTHAAGTIFENEIVVNEDSIVKIFDIYGNETKTSYAFVSLKEWFENEIKNDETDRIYINATEGGAPIKGTKVMLLEDVINTYCKTEIYTNERINKFLKNNNNQFFEEITGITEKLEKNMTAIALVKTDIERGLVAIADIFDRWRKNLPIDDYYIKIMEINGSIKKRIDKLYIFHYVLETIFHRYLYKQERSLDSSLLERTQKFEKIYYDLREELTIVELLMRNCIDNLKNMQ